MNRFYLAYGSNLNLDQMEYRCPGAVCVGSGMLDGYRLMFKGSGSGCYLTIEKSEGHKVPVGIWKVSAAHERTLDVYEGCPRFYYKKEIPHKLKGKISGKEIDADLFVYIMHEDRKLGMPCEAYVEGCREGYKSFGFDEKYIDEALEYTAQNMAS